MKAINDQTLYQCDYCGKRFVTRSGARRHEENHCSHSPRARMRFNSRRANCQHKNLKTSQMIIDGKAYTEKVCIDCREIFEISGGGHEVFKQD